MISIEGYLEKIYLDLKAQVDSGEKLCELKELTFEAGCLPDYTNIQIQRLYLLRYAFAYLFEYETMYSEVLQKMNRPSNISVTSIGCGTMIDYWALVRAIKKRNLDCSINYLGVDTIDWSYKIKNSKNDEVIFLQRNAQQVLKESNELRSDVYFFPKSISEFSDKEFEDITECFEKKPICKNVVFVCISVRANEGSMERDILRTKKIVDALWNNGFKANKDYNLYTHYTENIGIAAYDTDYSYPNFALEYVKNLNRRCESYISQGANCKSDCTGLNRSPVLKTGLINYQVIKFERV